MRHATYDPGGEFVAQKPFTYLGVEYRRGDIFRGAGARVRQLLDGRMIQPAGVVEKKATPVEKEKGGKRG